MDNLNVTAEGNEFNVNESAAKYRKESDSIGTLDIPEDAYYGVQSLRAMHNFPITGRKLHPAFIKNLAKIKRACAITNKACGLLKPEVANAIEWASCEVMAGQLLDEFIVDAIQGGASKSNLQHKTIY